jgi:phosphoribosyl 1,2-cyclic phosphodiesterase
MHNMTLEFHGVRGSIATPGDHTTVVGGNTSCVEVNAGDTRIVLDAGTGLRTLGDRLVRTGPSNTTILLSHVHWDHIQGFPFFVPLYVPGNEITVMSGPNGFRPLAEVLRSQMSPPVFPVALDEVAAKVSAVDLKANQQFSLGPVDVRIAKLNHPDPVYAFRLDYMGRSLVYATDTEHFSCVDPALCALAKDVDVLIYDAMYTPEEYRGDVGPSKVGWGHSTYAAAAELAHAAGAKKLVLFHHDPARSDDEVAHIERCSRELFANSDAAREGMRIELSARPPRTMSPGSEEACAA